MDCNDIFVALEGRHTLKIKRPAFLSPEKQAEEEKRC